MMDCCQLLIAQHAETRNLLNTLGEKIEACTVGLSGMATVEAIYEALVLDLKQHFVLEEQGFFETLSQYRSMMLMEVEHDDLLSLQNALGQAVKACRDEPGLSEAGKRCFEAFKTRLLAHMQEEETGIFPLARRCLEPEEHQKVLRRFAELQQGMMSRNVSLKRPEPHYEVIQTALFRPATRPVQYKTLYEREHSSVQHLSLQAGQKLAEQWAGQHQCLLVLSGDVAFSANGNLQTLGPGMMARLDSRLWFSLQANTESHLVLFRVWPHPHYTKTYAAEHSQ